MPKDPNFQSGPFQLRISSHPLFRPPIAPQMLLNKFLYLSAAQLPLH